MSSAKCVDTTLCKQFDRITQTHRRIVPHVEIANLCASVDALLKGGRHSERGFAASSARQLDVEFAPAPVLSHDNDLPNRCASMR
jgi:hypothetical protein